MIPGTFPANEVLRLLDVIFRSSGFTACTAPTRDSFFCLPKPTTTTSSSIILLSGANCIVNIPSTSVITPFCVPLSNTVAPITGSPFSSPTYPLISAFTSFCWLSSIFLLSAAVTTETGNNVKANHNRMQQLSLVRHPCFTLQFIYQ